MAKVKPRKPWPDYPLTPHNNGQWVKKVNGTLYYYGKWADPMAALERYYKSKEYHENGEQPPPDCGTVGELVDEWLADRQRAVDSGELDAATFDGYDVVAGIIKGKLRERPLASLIYPDFSRLRSALSAKQKGQGKTIAVTTLNRRLTVARMIFKFAENLAQPIRIRYDGLQSPPAKLLRQARNESGERWFTPQQIRYLIDNGGELRPLVLLGINAAFGPTDCMQIEGRWIRGEWSNFPRPKTAVPRRCWLWPETRRELPDTKGLLFPDLDRHELKSAFKELMGDFYVPGRGMYDLRRSFETIAGYANVPQFVIDKVMGHEDGSMAETYRQKVSDKLLRRCCEHVRGVVYGKIELD